MHVQMRPAVAPLGVWTLAGLSWRRWTKMQSDHDKVSNELTCYEDCASRLCFYFFSYTNVFYEVIRKACKETRMFATSPRVHMLDVLCNGLKPLVTKARLESNISWTIRPPNPSTLGRISLFSTKYGTNIKTIKPKVTWGYPLIASLWKILMAHVHSLSDYVKRCTNNINVQYSY